VRDAAKSAVVTLMAIHGEEVLQPLENCEQISERQLSEYRAKYAAIIDSQVKDDHLHQFTREYEMQMASKRAPRRRAR
jgi:hypothetical protein